MNKKILATAAGFGIAALLVSPAFAETSSSTPATGNAATKIACVGAAVNAREQAIDSAATTFTAAMNAAYSARATALQQAYTGSDLKSVRSAVKSAWSTFNASVKSARKAWQSAKSSAWSKYRSAANTCKAPAGTGDGANSDSEF